MPSARHGCAGAFLDGRVYVLGGEYVARDPKAPFCVSIDMDSPDRLQNAWTPLAAEPIRVNGNRRATDKIAFVPVAAAWGR